MSSNTRKSSQKKPVAAVIRPIPRQLGKQGALRIDPANSSVPKSHARGYSLSDYVTWLRKKIEADGTIPEQAQAAPAAEHAPATTETTDDIFSNITDTDLVQVLDNRDVSTASSSKIAGVRFEEFSDAEYAIENQPSETIQRIDTPHGMQEPSEQARKAMFPFSDLYDLSDKPRETGPVSGENTQALIAAVSKAIASVITEMPEPVFEQRVKEHLSSEQSINAETIAQAQRLDDLKRAQLESLAETKTGSNHYFDVQSTEAMENEPVPTEPVPETETAQNYELMQETFEQQHELEEPALTGVALPQPLVSLPTESDKVASAITSKSSKEIPSGVAAWDVEDFRWPVVTSQMIVSGGQAIDNLAESVFGMLSPSRQRLAITGLNRGDGSSSIAISLARWVSAFGKSVLLVDADLTSTNSLSSQIGLAPNLSWINAVSQSLPAAEVIVRSQKMNLCVMPLAPMVSRTDWPRFIYDNLGELIDQVRSYFDLVIVDTGPSAQLLAELSRPRHMVDATLMVHDGEETPEFKQAKNMLEGFGLDRFVVAKNRVHQKTVNAA